jgi:pantoate--beta-alanine ligase
MKTISNPQEMNRICRGLSGKIGFVPTMGYLHQGHLSLVRESQKISDYTIVSIYLNPAQFAANEDLAKYPTDLRRDRDLLDDLKVDFLFLPDNNSMYPPDFKTWVNVEQLTAVLCGKSRPTHFRGVTTIVCKLLHIIDPDFLFLGEKDFQQLRVLQQMVKDLDMRTKVIGCPLIREDDGLAMSSRNKYLNARERKKALCLFKALHLAKKMYAEGIDSASKIISEMEKLILAQEGKIDYLDIINQTTLHSVAKADKNSRVVLAVYIGKTRLLDNMLITD